MINVGFKGPMSEISQIKRNNKTFIELKVPVKRIREHVVRHTGIIKTWNPTAVSMNNRTDIG